MSPSRAGCPIDWSVSQFSELYSFGPDALCTFQPVIPKRPINRDVPDPDAETKPKPPPEPKSQTPKLLAGLVVLALIFIVAAIVFATGSSDEKSGTEVTAAAPATSQESDDGEPSPPVAEALAFPSFATNNTTRIGGPDPASNAAGVALAVFPSTTEAQRPTAVALVDEGDTSGAIAAAVLMAPPLRAPIVFSRGRELPAVSAEALEALNPKGSHASGGVSVFATGSVNRDALPIDGRVETVLGARPTPFGKAAAIARLREGIAGPPKHFVVASASKAAFAAPAAAWAARSGDPVLYTERASLPPETAEVLHRHPKTPVYVLGPESVISKNVVKEIAKVSKHVNRVAGKDPAETALALARYHRGSFGWNINDPGHGFVLARSDSPADAAAAAPLSASGTWGPLLLTEDPDRLPEVVHSYFLDVKPGYTTDPTRAFYNHVWVIGDQDAIDVAQQAEVNELMELTKIGGEG
jgi:putative cell wall binding repeat protein